MSDRNDSGVLRALLLRDGKPGHETKSDGLLRYLRERRSVQVSEAVVTLPLAFLFRPLLTLLIQWLPSVLWRGLIRRLYRVSIQRAEPLLVIGSGGKLSFLVAALNAYPNVTGVFIGSPRSLPTDCFGRLYTTDGKTGNDRVRRMILPPAPHAPATEAQRSAARQGYGLASDDKVLAVLVGGDGAGCRYSLQDWRVLAAAISEVAFSSGWHILFSTSRRTGPEAELMLKDQLSELSLHKAVWFGQYEERCVGSFLAAADAVLVTADSVSMIAEACSAGHRPYLFTPAQAEFPTRVQALITRLYQENYCRYHTALAEDLVTMERSVREPSPIDTFWRDEAERLLAQF